MKMRHDRAPCPAGRGGDRVRMCRPFVGALTESSGTQQVVRSNAKNNR